MSAPVGASGGAPAPPAAPAPAESRILVRIGENAKRCRVCGKAGHQVGFQGAVYIDCPNKPCYLCKKEGHTTTTCPYRARARARPPTLDQPQLRSIVDRERAGGAMPPTWRHAMRDGMVYESAPKLFKRRVSALAFHPHQTHIVVAGSKFGELGVWNYSGSGDTSVLAAHEYMINGLAFDRAAGNALFTASLDGTLRHVDLETSCVHTLLDANPGGWVTRAAWRMMMAVESSADWGFVLVGDDVGRAHMVDPRAPGVARVARLHRKDKITCLAANPCMSNLLLSTSNDHTMRLWDVRRLDTTGTPLAVVNHPRLVTSAYFSPRTGSRIASTCTDNRIRVWDSLYADLRSPSRDIVHSQDFSRYISPFRAVWDPKDPHERVLYCGRFISENVSGHALHPIDVLDAATGHLVGAIADPAVSTISPVVVPHPEIDAVAAGSSSSLYIWRPKLFRPTRAVRCGPSALEPVARASIRSAGSAGSPAALADGLHSLAASRSAARSRAAPKAAAARAKGGRARTGASVARKRGRTARERRSGDEDATFHGAGEAGTELQPAKRGRGAKAPVAAPAAGAAAGAAASAAAPAASTFPAAGLVARCGNVRLVPRIVDMVSEDEGGATIGRRGVGASTANARKGGAAPAPRKRRAAAAAAARAMGKGAAKASMPSDQSSSSSSSEDSDSSVQLVGEAGAGAAGDGSSDDDFA